MCSRSSSNYVRGCKPTTWSSAAATRRYSKTCPMECISATIATRSRAVSGCGIPRRNASTHARTRTGAEHFRTHGHHHVGKIAAVNHLQLFSFEEGTVQSRVQHVHRLVFRKEFPAQGLGGRLQAFP